MASASAALLMRARRNKAWHRVVRHLAARYPDELAAIITDRHNGGDARGRQAVRNTALVVLAGRHAEELDEMIAREVEEVVAEEIQAALDEGEDPPMLPDAGRLADEIVKAHRLLEWKDCDPQ